MCKKRLFKDRKSKLMSRGDGLFQILERINSNACKVDLPGSMVLVLLLIFFYLSLFDVGYNSRSNPFDERGNDAIKTILKDPLEVLDGLITR